MDIKSKEEFIYFMQRACEDQSNDCYIELYNILLRFCFIKKIAFLVEKNVFLSKKICALVQGFCVRRLRL